MKQVLAVFLALLLVVWLVGCSSAPAKEISITEPLKTLGETVENGIQTTAPNSESTTNPTSVPPTTKPASVPPTTKPTSVPTTKPTSVPTTKPTSAPTTKPTSAPTTKPTSAPTTEPIHSHSYVETVIKQATCTENGITQYTCSCGDSYTEAIPGARGHNWANATCISPKTCLICGVTEGGFLSHTYNTAGTCTMCGRNAISVTKHHNNKTVLLYHVIGDNTDNSATITSHSVNVSGYRLTISGTYTVSINSSMSNAVRGKVKIYNISAVVVEDVTLFMKASATNNEQYSFSVTITLDSPGDYRYCMY